MSAGKTAVSIDTSNMANTMHQEKFSFVDAEMAYEILLFMHTMLPGSLDVFQMDREITLLTDDDLVKRFMEYYHQLTELRLRKDIWPNNLARAIVNLYIIKLVHRFILTKEGNLLFSRIIKEKQRHMLESESHFWNGLFSVIDDVIVQIGSYDAKRLPKPFMLMLDPINRTVMLKTIERISKLEDALDVTPMEDDATRSARWKARSDAVLTVYKAKMESKRRKRVVLQTMPMDSFQMESLPPILQSEVLKKVDRLTINKFASTSKNNKQVHTQEKEAFYSKKMKEDFQVNGVNDVNGVLVFVHTMLPGVLDVFKMNREITALDDPTFYKRCKMYYLMFKQYMKRDDIEQNPLAFAVMNYYTEKLLQRLLSTKDDSCVFARKLKKNDRHDLEEEYMFMEEILALTDGGLVQIMDTPELPAILLSKWKPINRAVSSIAIERFRQLDAALKVKNDALKAKREAKAKRLLA